MYIYIYMYMYVYIYTHIPALPWHQVDQSCNPSGLPIAVACRRCG